MKDMLDELVALIQPDQVVVDRFLGQPIDLGWGRLFGGHVLGQALGAASKAVDQGWLAHSLHGYFLRPGAVDAPVLYEVDRIRDGKSFATRRVVARQRGEVILNMSASFHREEEGFDHQLQMPEVPGPEELSSEVEMKRTVAHRIPEEQRDAWVRERPIEMRPVQQTLFFEPEVREPIRQVWFRAGHPVPDDPLLHRCLLAYTSDFALLSTALLPHGVTFRHPDMQIASIDHAMWIHREFRIDEWLLYSMESPSASNGTGFVRGSIFSRDGQQVASVAQEGLIRRRERKDSKPVGDLGTVSRTGHEQ
jgi:acyl-CoA thioesterase-2